MLWPSPSSICSAVIEGKWASSHAIRGQDPSSRIWRACCRREPVNIPLYGLIALRCRRVSSVRLRQLCSAHLFSRRAPFDAAVAGFIDKCAARFPTFQDLTSSSRWQITRLLGACVGLVDPLSARRSTTVDQDNLPIRRTVHASLYDVAEPWRLISGMERSKIILAVRDDNPVFPRPNRWSWHYAQSVNWPDVHVSYLQTMAVKRRFVPLAADSDVVQVLPDTTPAPHSAGFPPEKWRRLRFFRHSESSESPS